MRGGSGLRSAPVQRNTADPTVAAAPTSPSNTHHEIRLLPKKTEDVTKSFESGGADKGGLRDRRKRQHKTYSRGKNLNTNVFLVV